MVYLNPADSNQRADAINLLNHTFINQNLTVQVRDGNPVSRAQKQFGAMQALSQAALLQWFDGYDWVIRLNPDVIVRDDTFLVDVIKNDPRATALLINCDGVNNSTRAHTDFFALKPEALRLNAFLHPSNPNAEYSFTHDIQSILESGGHRWIREAFPTRNACMAGYGKRFVNTPITHFHFDPNTPTCPIPLKE